MIPMWRGHGCKVRAGSFSQRPASCCVLPITPWSISLNMPSPPTHTTLLKVNTRVFVKWGNLPAAFITLYYHINNITILTALTHQSLSGLSSEGGLLPGWPVQSLQRKEKLSKLKTGFRISQSLLMGLK